MKLTARELQQIENTTDKLFTVANALLPRESTDHANARALSYIVGELRLAADLMQNEDVQTRAAGTQRLLNLFANI